MAHWTASLSWKSENALKYVNKNVTIDKECIMLLSYPI